MNCYVCSICGCSHETEHLPYGWQTYHVNAFGPEQSDNGIKWEKARLYGREAYICEHCSSQVEVDSVLEKLIY